MPRRAATANSNYSQRVNRFSPSPIKRYTRNAQHQSQADNKENIGGSQQSAILKQQSKKYQQVKSQKRQPLKELEDNLRLRDNNQKQLNLKAKDKLRETKKVMETSDEKIVTEIAAATTKKREEKIEMKAKEVLGEGGESQEKQQASDEQIIKEDKSTEQKGTSDPAINKLIDKESDSLMEGTYQSEAGRQSLGSVQYQGRWTNEEHEKFIEGLKLFGKDWRKIEEHIGSRTCAQIRSHAQKYFNRIQREIAKGKRKDDATLSLIKKPKPSAGLVFSQTNIPVEQTPLKIHQQTNQQIEQINQTLQKITEDDLVFQLKQLITQREQICFEYLTKRSNNEESCERMINITNRFHQLAMQALQNYKCKLEYIIFIVELCNRLIDERNLSQFLCILFSKQVLITPANELNEQEIIQHVELTPVGDNCQTQQDQHSQSHDKDTAKSSPFDYQSKVSQQKKYLPKALTKKLV